MGLWQKAVETYDTFADIAGVEIPGMKAPLPPVSHLITSADLEITLDETGKYISSRKVDKKEPKIIIPVTEDSVGRSSNAMPHPLCDQLCYLAPYNEEKHSAYINQLENWVNSPYSHPKLHAILNYVQGGTILRDLSKEDLIETEAIPVSWMETPGIRPVYEYKPIKEKLLVRWRIEDGSEGPACWKDKTLFDAWIQYYDDWKKKNAPSNLCMITGETLPAATIHAKGIVPIYGNAKLISHNDSRGFTYRGRFSEDWQSAAISYTASQKAHNALRWLIANQGVRITMSGHGKVVLKDDKDQEYTIFGGRTFLCWSPKGNSIPAASVPLRSKEAAIVKRMEEYRTDLRQILEGYRHASAGEGGVVIAAFDAATAGRLAVTYYNELKMSDYLERLIYWDETCCWENGIYGIQSPDLYSIVRYAYGMLRDGDIVSPQDGIFRQQMQRLMNCRIDKGPMPKDIVENLVEKTSNLKLYKKGTRIRLLSIACAVIRKYHMDRNTGEIDMELNKSNSDPSYLFGRLLALAEKAERDTYSKDETREPNAMRYQKMFSQRPLNTWRTLEEKLKPYYKKLSPSTRQRYRETIEEIIEMLPTGQDLNKRLKDTYLIGYYTQRADLYK